MTVRGQGKRVRSTSPGIEGRIVVESASASVASGTPMSAQDRETLRQMARDAYKRIELSAEQQADLDTAAERALGSYQQLLARPPRRRPSDQAALMADLATDAQLMKALRSDPAFAALAQSIANETQSRLSTIVAGTYRRLRAVSAPYSLC